MGVAEVQLLTVEETARTLRQSVSTIRQKVYRGELKAVRLGEFGPLRIPADAVERHLRPVPSLARAAGRESPSPEFLSHSLAAGTPSSTGASSE